MRKSKTLVARMAEIEFLLERLTLSARYEGWLERKQEDSPLHKEQQSATSEYQEKALRAIRRLLIARKKQSDAGRDLERKWSKAQRSMSNSYSGDPISWRDE